MKRKTKKYAAFSLVELIIYTAIASVIAAYMVLISIDIVRARGERQSEREVLENARFAMNMIERQVRDATGLSSGSFGSHPGSVTFTKDGGGALIFSTNTKTLGTQTLRYLQMNNGSGNEQLTSDKVNITNFVINELTRATETENLQFEITFEYLDGSESLSLRTALSLRE